MGVQNDFIDGMIVVSMLAQGLLNQLLHWQSRMRQALVLYLTVYVLAFAALASSKCTYAKTQVGHDEIVVF